MNDQPRRIYCYRQYAHQNLDEEQIWSDLQRWGGSLSIRGDCIDWYVPESVISLFLLKYPELTRQLNLEYI